MSGLAVDRATENTPRRNANMNLTVKIYFF